MDFFARLICLYTIIFFCDCSVTMDPKISVNKNILNDKNVCDGTKQIINSTYLKRCNELSHQDDNINTISDLVFCLAMYDRSYQVCHITLVTSSAGSPINLLNNLTLFDAEISKKIKEYNSLGGALTICELITKPSLYSLNETKKYAEQLEKLPDCQHACYILQQLNPLCMVIYIIDKQLEELYTQFKKSNIVDDNQYDNLDDDVLEISTEKISISMTSESVIIEKNLNDIQLENESHDHLTQHTHHNYQDKIVSFNEDVTQLESPEYPVENKSLNKLLQPVSNKCSNNFTYLMVIPASCIIGLMIVVFFRRNFRGRRVDEIELPLFRR